MKSFVFPVFVSGVAGEPASNQFAKLLAGSTCHHVRLHSESGASDGCHLQTPPTGSNLLSQTETTNQLVIATDVNALQIVEHAAALADHLKQAAPRVIVFLVRLEMIGQFIDAFGQERHLNFR